MEKEEWEYGSWYIVLERTVVRDHLDNLLGCKEVESALSIYVKRRMSDCLGFFSGAHTRYL